MYITEKNQISLIVFRVGREEFVIDLLDVKEIIQSQQIRRLPQSFEFIEGIYNYRGDIIHIINLRKKLRLSEYIIYRRKENIEKLPKNEGEKGKELEDGKNEIKRDIEIVDIKEEEKQNFIIIVNINDTSIGFYVDEIINVSHVGYNELEALSPIFQTSVSMEYIRAIVRSKDKPRIFIDLAKVLSEEELIEMKKIN